MYQYMVTSTRLEESFRQSFGNAQKFVKSQKRIKTHNQIRTKCHGYIIDIMNIIALFFL